MSNYKLGQVLYCGNQHVLIIKDNHAYVLTDKTGPKEVLHLVSACDENRNLRQVIEDVFSKYSFESLSNEFDLINGKTEATLLIPLNPPEVWAVGVTYKRQAREHDIDMEKRTGSTEELYYRVYSNERAEVFFKGFDRSTRGPGESITLRADSMQVMPEAEMVMVLGKNGLPVAFTAGNDLTAWDIELDCPLYLNQAKIWDGSGSVGPFIVPVDDFGDPYDREVAIEVVRSGNVILESKGSTSELKRSLEELCYWLNYNNGHPAGTLLFTGTGCVIPHDFALEDKDIVTVFVDNVGRLSNPVQQLIAPEKQFRTR